MEGESNAGEPFLRIEKFWSETEENFDNIPIKEENISDVDTEDLLEIKDSSHTNSSKELINGSVDSSDTQMKELQDEKNGQRERNDGEKSEAKVQSPIVLAKSTDSNNACLHEAKNFKLLKKRLSCVDCRAILCPECHCSITSSLQNHFANADNCTRSLYACKLCSMIFKSNCALQAHVRIHLLDKPYVCPDCGAIYNNIYFLSLHLINKCYHVYKVVKSGCKFCLCHNMAPEGYVAHIKEVHIKPIYKCSHCGVLFNNSPDICRHLAASHKNENAKCLNYFCCNMCRNLIISSSIYGKHIKYHQEYTAAYHISYLCSCNVAFGSLGNFRAHFKDCSKKGILPPQWTYLQVTLKTQEMAQIVHQKNILSQSESSNLFDSDKESSNEPGKIDLGLFQDDDSSDGVDEWSEESLKNSLKESDISSNTNNGKEESCAASGSGFTQKTVTRSIDISNNVNGSRRKSISRDNGENSGLDGEKKPSGDMDNDIPGPSGDMGNDIPGPSGDMGNDIPRPSDDMGNDIPGPSDEMGNDIPGPSDDMGNDIPGPSDDMGNDIPGPGDDMGNDIPGPGDDMDNNIPGPSDGHQENSNEGSLDINERSSFVPNVQLVEELSLESQEEVQSVVHGEKVRDVDEKTSQNEDGNMKLLYDHIPCDHLGYLKTQRCSRPHDKEREETTCDYDDGALMSESDKFLITSVLDEKTGLMRTKKVLKQKSDASNIDESPEGDDSLDDSDIFPDFQHRELLKSGPSFTCPFCSILFPKYYSSFHRFRLHLEYYHPDASLDITVDRTQTPKSQTQFTSITMSDDNYSDEDSYDLDDIDLQTRLNSLYQSEEDDEEEVEEMENQSEDEDEKRWREVVENNIVGNRELRGKFGETIEDEGPENNQNSQDKIVSSFSRSSFSKKSEKSQPLVKRGMSQDSEEMRNSALTEISVIGFESHNNDLLQDREPHTSHFGNFDDYNSESLDSENSFKNVEPKRMSNYDIIEQVKADHVLRRKQISILNHKKKWANENVPDNMEMNEVENFEGQEKIQDSDSMANDANEKEYYLRNVQDGSKSHSDDAGVIDPYDFERSESRDSMELRGRDVERKNSRRESDVWSEFYKTLKIAETLKKAKVKSKERKESGEASILTNYANKRIVKKPKRYRESSDSEESEDGKQSPSFSKSLDSSQDEQETYLKKKRLIRRLESVDYRILEYVCKLLERKQKNHGAAKKPVEGGGVRGMRKRMSNGVKVHGKQLKATVDDDDRLESSNSGLMDVNGYEMDGDAPTEEKNMEKKRGRPKKLDPATVKERRRSDLEREVNFIEKNFESDENEFVTNKRKRKLSSKLQYYKKISIPAEKNEFSSGQVISTTKNFENEKKLTCAVCKESYQSDAEFREHIQTHRMDDNSYQCMECGECFVVRPSLEKHLHAFHKIKDVQKYILENECSVGVKPEELETEPLKENQCKVCRDEFPNIHELNKHFRIHGMAFLQQFKKENKPN